jgi:hypothetical protein
MSWMRRLFGLPCIALPSETERVSTPNGASIEAEYRMMKFSMDTETSEELRKFYQDVAAELRRQRDESDVRYWQHRVRGDLGG